MNSNNGYKKSDWIGKQKARASAPPALRKIASLQTLEHYSDLVPSPYLPITKMLEFTLLLQNATATPLRPPQFFILEAPDSDDQALVLRVQRLPIPDSKTINKLLASYRRAWLEGAQSVFYSHFDLLGSCGRHRGSMGSLAGLSSVG
ncbi:hypothetical protein DFH08DRAFT_820706 [Mycena albidolilacea]|uniref:Uncharacterized protein n=1 Tax=Mycena albidolilacea TaxID=1033008 RepID=A0AAD6ZB77_9AGAR|nr:hypothetical protein DFH08DRAFT_820706 [Mycena albidolilacea]